MTAGPLLLPMPTPLLVTKHPIQGLEQGPDKADEEQAYLKAGTLNSSNTKVSISAKRHKYSHKSIKNKHAN